MPHVVITVGEKRRRVDVPAAPDHLAVGSGPDNDVRLPRRGVDRNHAQISLTPTGVRIRDLGTTQGTRLNGNLVSQAVLRPGDEILIGPARISLGAEKPRPRPAPRAEPPPRRASAPARSPVDEDLPRPVRRRRKQAPVGLILGAIVVLVAVGGGYLLLGGSKAEKESRAALATARAARESGDADAARRGFAGIVERWPGSAAAAEAGKALDEIEAAANRERAAAAAKDRLRERWREVPYSKIVEEWEALGRKYPDAAALTDGDFLAEVKSEYDRVARLRFEETKARAGELLDRSRYSDATLVWDEYIAVTSQLLNVEPDIEAATREFRRIDARAKEEWLAVEQEADSLIEAERYEEAKALLRGRLSAFRGTRHAFDARQKLELVGVLATVETVEPEKVEQAVDRREEFLRASEDAEALVRRRQYGEAVAAYEKAAAAAPFDDLRSEFESRAADLRDDAFLFTELIRQIEADPKRFRGLDLGAGLTANAVSADESVLVVTIRGAESRLPFDRMAPARVTALLARMQLDPEGQLRLARFAFETGAEEVAHRAITVALRKEPALADRAFAMIARARGIDVPDGGFVEYGGRWITPAEKTAAELADRIADAEIRAMSTDRRRREAGLAELREIGEPAVPTLVKVLEHRRVTTVGELVALPILKDRATKQALLAEINVRRKKALTLIFDAEKYPYPYGPDGNAKVNAEVDGLVERVREIWDDPLGYLVEKRAEVRELVEAAREMSAELEALDHAPEVPLEDLLAKANDALSIRRFTPGATERSALDWNDRVREFNREIDIGADDEEKACVVAVNEYRNMMGMKSVKWNAELLKAARGHSKHMRENDYFAHDVPPRFGGPENDAVRTPALRARQAGYGGGVSENIARGSDTGVGSFRQWKGSSGHHRNLLNPGHTEVGVGRDQDFWTQNFGRASKSLDLPKKKPSEGGR